MAAKRGFPLEDRLQMGYHSVPGRMALVYSREGVARSLRLLEAMTADIRQSFFLPDATRSGRLLSPATEIMGAGCFANQSASGVQDQQPLAAEQGDGDVKSAAVGNL